VQEQGLPAAAGRHRLAFRYSVDGDLRFISHHDTLRLFRRALARAEVPVRFSEGFNPAPRISIPLPRPVGMASDDELLVVDLERPVDSQDALVRLRTQMPEGLVVHDVRALPTGEKPHPHLVRYRLDVNGEPESDLQRKAGDMLAAPALAVERPAAPGKAAQKLDVRKYLVDLTFVEHGVEFTLCVTGSGTARPSEIAGLLLSTTAPLNHRIRRTSVTWQTRTGREHGESGKR
jgi:radical SAM-linked protein